MKRRLSLFLAILILISVMCTAPVSVSAEDTEPQEISVYFENNRLWSNVFYHTWGSSLDLNTNWGNGVVAKVGKSVNGYDVYKAVVGSDAMGVIFAGIKNDGSGAEDQTPNIEDPDIFDGACYSMMWDEGYTTVVSNIADVCPDMGDEDTTQETTENTEPTQATVETQTPETDPTEVPVEETFTVYFENNWKWEVPTIYWFGNTTGQELEWPGIEMTYHEKNELGNDIFVAEVPFDIEGIVFSGNDEQCEDILIGWYDGVCYYMEWDEVTGTKNAVAYNYYPGDPEETEPATETTATEETAPEDNTEPTETTEENIPLETYTVYYVDSGNFETAYAYAWTDGDNPNEIWPGVPMTLTDIVSPDGSPVYSYTATTLYEYIIFSNGSDMQTEDLEFVPDGYLWWTDEVWYDDIKDISTKEDTPEEDDNLPDGTASLAGYTISLGGKIAINYYYRLSDDVANAPDAGVVFTIAGSETAAMKILVEDAEYDSTYYIFTCEVAAKEMTTLITSQFVSEIVTTEVNEYTVKDYAESMLRNADTFEAEQSLVKAMLNYGAAAQLYFNYKTDDLANDTEYMTEDEKEIRSFDASGYQLNVTGDTSTDYLYGATLSLESETVFKLYFSLNSDTANLTEIEAYVDGELTTAVRNGNLFELQISNIPAHLLSEVHTVQIGDMTVQTAPLLYVKLAQNSSNQLLVDVSNAVAVYSEEACLYIA